MSNSSDNHTSLLIPGLFGPSREQIAELSQAYQEPVIPVLKRMLARGDVVADPVRTVHGADSFHTQLFDLFGVRSEPQADLPVAAVTRLADGGAADSGWCIRADPVSLVPQGGGLILHAADQLRLTREQAESLRQDILAVFEADGWVLEAPAPQRWYLRLPATPDIHTHALGPVTGHDIHTYLPQGPDARAWRVIMNEIQILLHTSGVNIERESRGLMPVNSLWFWGGGCLPARPAPCWERVWSNEPVSRGLAILSGIPCENLTDSCATILQTSASGRQLVVFSPDFPGATLDDWKERMEWLDAQWLAPLLAQVRAGGLASLTLRTTGGAGYCITRSNVRRWWRRQRKLSDYNRMQGSAAVE